MEIKNNEVIESNKNGLTLWFTGSGKSKIAKNLKEIIKNKYQVQILDGDVMRNGLNKDLKFSLKDRNENIRRIAEVAKVLAKEGTIVIVALISPIEQARQQAKEIHKNANVDFYQVFIDSPLYICEKRDVKGLYKKARKGEIKNFTGYDSPFEIPKNADIILNTNIYSVSESVAQLIDFLILKGYLNNIYKNLMSNIYQSSIYNIIELFISQDEIINYNKLAKSLISIELNKTDVEWIQILSEGWASPLKGFMKENEYLQTLHFNSITFNKKIYNFSIPIVLSLPNNKKIEIESQNNNIINISLIFNNKIIAVLLNCEIFQHRKEERCSRQFGTISLKHPSIKIIYNQSDWLIGGDLKVFERILWNDGLDKYRLTPLEIRLKIKNINADAVYAFQLRNPLHNGHETKKKLLNKNYKNPILLLHPLGGWTKIDDIPLNIRIQQHLAVINEGLLDSKSILLAIFPSPMIYAGPTEVQWHCRCRIIAGANFYIVGRDPAGIPHPDINNIDLYNPTHGSRLISIAPGLDEIKIIPFLVAAYNIKSKSMEIYDPSKKDEFIFISGTKMRNLAKKGIEPPNGFMVPSGWNIMVKYYQSLNI